MKLIDLIKEKQCTIGHSRKSATYINGVWVGHKSYPRSSKEQDNINIGDIDEYFKMSPVDYLKEKFDGYIQPRLTLYINDIEHWALYENGIWNCYMYDVNLDDRYVGKKTEIELVDWLNSNKENYVKNQ